MAVKGAAKGRAWSAFNERPLATSGISGERCCWARLGHMGLPAWELCEELSVDCSWPGNRPLRPERGQYLPKPVYAQKAVTLIFP